MRTMGRLRALRGLPRAAWVLFGASAMAALAAAVLALPGGGGPADDGAALADLVPAGCDTTIGAGGAIISAPGTVPPVTQGQTINYRVGAAYPNDALGVACQAFNIQVYILLPGDNAASEWQFVCTIAELDEGESELCPLPAVSYTADAADRNGELLQAFADAIGDKHDGTQDCVTPDKNPNGGRTTNPCFGGQATSNISMPTPTATPTPTSTPTNTPTSTPTNTPENTPTNTPEREVTPSNPPPEFETPTAPPNTPTSVNTVLPATEAPPPPPPTPTTPAGTVLPPAGSGSGPMANLTYPVAALAALAIVFAGTGLVVARRRA